MVAPALSGVDPVVIVLAAGQGSRFGGPQHKLMAPWRDGHVLGATLHQVLASGLPMLVVTQARFADEATKVVARRDVLVLGAKGGPALGGMSDSIAAGVQSRPGSPGWLILPADMPLVRPQTLRAVAQALRRHPVAYAQHQGSRGHPVGFAAELYGDLVALHGDEGARRVLGRYPAQAVVVDDPGCLVDIDTEADLAAARAEA